MSDSQATIIRSLDISETQYWLFDRVSTTNFSVFAPGKGKLDSKALRHSLNSLQSLYPSTQVGIRKSADSKNLVFVRKENDIPLLIKEVGDNQWQQVLAVDAMQPFNTDDAPLLRAILYSIDENHWVFSLVFHHSAADARSGIRFFKEVFSHLGSSPIYSKRRKFKDPMHEVLPDAAVEKLAHPGALTIPEPENLPVFSGKKSEAAPKLAILRIDQQRLKTIRHKAWDNSVSVHGVLGAIQLKAIASLYGKFSSENIPLNLTTPADTRHYLKNQPDEADLALYTTVLTSHLQVGENTPFWELARAISENVKAQLNDMEGLLFYKKLSDPTQFLKKDSALKAFSFLMQLMPQASVLSNVGVVADFPMVHGIELDYLAFTSLPSVTQTVFVSVTTFQEGMTIVMNYDSNRWEKPAFELFYSNYCNTLSSLYD